MAMEQTAASVQDDRPGRFHFGPWTALRPFRPAVAQRAPTRAVGLVERSAALLGLIVFSPLMFAIAVFVKLDAPRAPVLYCQERVGFDRRRKPSLPLNIDRRRTPAIGQPFMICKFRTMVVDAEKLTGPVWASRRDPRITRIGSILRHLRLDELPQLLNVLRGEMRLIGPRPERPQFVQQLCECIPDYPARQCVPPGITGLAQIERQYDTCIDDVERKVKYDLYYARHRSRLLDLKILLKTIDVAVRGRGAH